MTAPAPGGKDREGGTDFQGVGGYEAAVNAGSTLTGRNLEPWRALLAVAGWLTDYGAAGLRERMEKLSEGYQAERPNVEAADLTALVIRALGLVVGKMVKDELDSTDRTDGSDRLPKDAVNKKQFFLLTTLITSAVQQVAEVEEIDTNNEHITTSKVGQLLTKMRLPKGRQGASGKRGWYVSLDDVVKWANNYSLDPTKTTGIQSTSLAGSGSPVSAVSAVRAESNALNPWHGVL